MPIFFTFFLNRMRRSCSFYLVPVIIYKLRVCISFQVALRSNERAYVERFMAPDFLNRIFLK